MIAPRKNHAISRAVTAPPEEASTNVGPLRAMRVRGRGADAYSSSAP